MALYPLLQAAGKRRYGSLILIYPSATYCSAKEENALSLALKRHFCRFSYCSSFNSIPIRVSCIKPFLLKTWTSLLYTILSIHTKFLCLYHTHLHARGRLAKKPKQIKLTQSKIIKCFCFFHLFLLSFPFLPVRRESFSWPGFTNLMFLKER